MALILLPPGVPVAISDRLGRLARWRRGWSISAGLFVWLAFMVFGLAVMTGWDLAVTLRPSVQTVFLALYLSASVWIYSRCVRRPWWHSESPLGVAFSLEKKHADLNDALASAASFKGEQNAFHHEAVRRAERATESLEWNAVLPLKRFWRSLLLFFVSLAALLTISVVYSERFGTAVKRFFDPWGKHSWPTRTTLEIGTFAERIAVGNGWSVAVKVDGVMPETATLQVRGANLQFEDTLPLDGHHDMRFGLDASRTLADFEFRISAGDAATGWRKVSVAPPPKLVAMNGRPSPNIRLEYPAYLGWTPSERFGDATTIDAVTGTRFTLTAEADRPITNAKLVYLGDREQLPACRAVAPLAALADPFAAVTAALLADGFTQDIPVTVSNRTRLQAGFTVPLGGLWSLKFQDETGLTGQKLIDFKIEADPTPSVNLIRPDAARDTLDLLPTGMFPLETIAEDRRYGAKMLAIQYRFGEAAWREIPVVNLEKASQSLTALTGFPVTFESTRPASLADRRVLRISQLSKAGGATAEAGDVITVRTVATDWDNVSPGKLAGVSREAVIRVQSAESLESQLKKRLAGLRAPLRKAADAQADAAKAGNLETAERAQAELRSKLTDPRDGFKAELDRLRRQQAVNGLPANSTTTRLEAVAKSLDRVEKNSLPKVDDALASAKKDPKSLVDVAKQQGQVAAELSTAARELDRWSGLAEIQSELQQLGERWKRAQSNLNQLKDRLPAGVPPEKLSGKERTELDSSAAELEAVQKSLKELQAKAEAVRGAKREAGEAAELEKLEKAIKAADAMQTVDELKKASEAVKQNRLSEASAASEAGADKLRSAEDALAGRDGDSETLKRRKAEQQERVEELKRKQVKLNERAKTEPKPGLADEQSSLAREAERLADETAAAGDPEKSEALQRAAEKMDEASEELAKNKDAAKAAEEAEKQLEEAAKKPEEPQPQQPEADAGFLPRVKVLRDRQQDAVREFLRLCEAAAQAKRWDRNLAAGLVKLAELESQLSKDVKELAGPLNESAPVFAKLLELAGRDLDRSGVRLLERKDDALGGDYLPENEAAADEVLRRPMMSALAKLQSIVDSLEGQSKAKEFNKAKPQDKAANPIEKGGEAKGANASKGMNPLAQLKALRDWQSEVTSRTAAFANAHPPGSPLTADDRADLAELQKAQAEITRLFESLKDSLMPKPEMP